MQLLYADGCRNRGVADRKVAQMEEELKGLIIYTLN